MSRVVLLTDVPPASGIGSGGKFTTQLFYAVLCSVNLSQPSSQLHQCRVRDRVSDRVGVRNRVRLGIGLGIGID